MNQEEFENLKTGDVIENLTTGSRYVIIDRRSTEPITQISKDQIRTRQNEFKIIAKKLNRDEHYI